MGVVFGDSIGVRMDSVGAVVDGVLFSELIANIATVKNSISDGVILGDSILGQMLYAVAVADGVVFGDLNTDWIFVLEGEYITFKAVQKPTVTYTVVKPSVTFSVVKPSVTFTVL